MRSFGTVLGCLFLTLLNTVNAAPPEIAVSASPQSATELSLDQGKTATMVTLAAHTYSSYYIDLPSNVSTLTVRTFGASGDVDLLIRQGIQHTATTVQGLIDQSAYVASSNNGNEQIVLDRASSPRPLTPGRWWLTLSNPTDLAVNVQLDASTTLAGTAFLLSAGQSGAWYQPSKTYQGYFLEMLSSSQALVIWFTYEPNGKQAYLLGVGDIVGDTITFPELTHTRGGRYGPSFNAANVVRENWGSLVMTFDSCSHGYASYLQSDLARSQGWPTEQLNIDRLTTISGLGCPTTFTANTQTQSKYLRSGSSGAFYDPSRSGEGWFTEMLTDTLGLIYWFTYTPTGDQAWFAGIGEIHDGSVVVRDATQPVGGRFGEGYDPAQVALNPWGDYTMTFTGCNTAVLAAYGSGAYGQFDNNQIERITTLAATNPCGFALPPVTVSGTVQAPGSSFADGDTNNLETPNRDNDVPAQEQALINPAIVSGFLAATGTGRAGDRFQTETDVFDAYTLPMVQGQVIRLAISDYHPDAPTAVDFDLVLYPADNPSQPLASSEGTGPIEQIIVPSTGTFDIVVSAFQGSGNYVLLVDNAGVALNSVPGALSSLNKTVPGDIIVALKQPDPGLSKAQHKAAELGLHYRAGAADRSMLFNIGDATQAKAAAKTLGVSDDPLLDPASPWFLSDPATRAAHALIGVIKALRARPEIAYAEPNGIATAQAVPNDPGYAYQWHYPLIHLPQAWDITTGSRNVVVAVIDTGAVNHPDLLANLDGSLGYDFISDPSRSLDGDGIDANAFDVGDQNHPDGSSSFHGTHVAGTVGAASNNGIGVAGVNWATTLMPVRVLGNGGGGIYDVAQGIRWSARMSNDSGAVPTRRADVINMSLGGAGECPSVYADALAAARSAAVVVIAAAGNESTSDPSSPASCTGVVSVSAVDRLSHLATYSNFGPNIDLAAPGGAGFGNSDSILSTMARDAGGVIFDQAFYSQIDGTSMATPHVAGVVALMKSVFPALTPQQFDGLLASGAITTDLANNGPTQRDDRFGYGLIDAFKAVGEARRLATAQTLPPVPQVLPSALDFGSTLITQNVAVSNIGQGSLTVTGRSSPQPWISVSAVSVNAQGLGTYAISVNRSGLQAANYAGQVNFVTSAGTQSVAVAMRAAPVQANGDVSTVYLLVIDSQTGQVITQAISNINAGQYAFTLPPILQGSYYVLAGTDIDNDGFICDAGEACGALFTLSDPSLIRFNVSVTLDPFSVLPDIGTVSGLGASAAAKRRQIDKPSRQSRKP